MELPFAENMPYWKTSSSGIENWLDKTEKLITEYGGDVNTRIAGKSNGKEAIMFGFTLESDRYKILWPILPTKKDSDRNAAARQAATMIYHDTKARVNRLKIFTPRVVFSDWLLLNNGKTLAETNTIGIPDALKLIE
ncbi:MAG: hypothetical protein AAF363_15665 [Bacteroidota bacterium]